MPKASMTPRERWLATLTGAKPDRLPMDYWGTPEATDRLLQHTGCSDAWELFAMLQIDRLLSVAPEYIGPPIDDDADIYGCRFQNISYGTGVYRECVYHPLAGFSTIEEIDGKASWPSADWFDYTVIPAQLRGKEEYPVQGGGSEPFLIYANLRGREQAYMDLVMDPEIVHHCLDKLFGFCHENTVRIYEQLPGRVDLSYVAEDFGAQERLLFSPDTIRTFFLPRMQRMIELAHGSGVRAFFHSDGAIRPIIADMIAAGIDVLNPIQWRSSGMERGQLKRDFGDKVIFHGGVDNQQTLPFGSVQDVRDEVIENIRTLGAGGGYILAPCHNIQAITPPENVLAMYAAGLEYGWC